MPKPVQVTSLQHMKAIAGQTLMYICHKPARSDDTTEHDGHLKSNSHVHLPQTSPGDNTIAHDGNPRSNRHDLACTTDDMSATFKNTLHVEFFH